MIKTDTFHELLINSKICSNSHFEFFKFLLLRLQIIYFPITFVDFLELMKTLVRLFTETFNCIVAKFWVNIPKSFKRKYCNYYALGEFLLF